MILYFSGTGNSAFVAKRLGALLEDEVVSINERLIANDWTALHSTRDWVIVSPIYAWNLPRIVNSFLMRTSFQGANAIYFVLTCASSVMGASGVIMKLVQGKGMQYRGCGVVKMPENYMVMFPVPSAEKCEKILDAAEEKCAKLAEQIRAQEMLQDGKTNGAAILSSRLMEDSFYTINAHDRKFTVDAAKCSHCEKCARLCPMQNIRMDVRKIPIWQGNCTHCMACIGGCPRAAIDYNGKLEDGPRYYCPRT